MWGGTLNLDDTAAIATDGQARASVRPPTAGTVVLQNASSEMNRATLGPRGPILVRNTIAMRVEPKITDEIRAMPSGQRGLDARSGCSRRRVR